MATLRPSRPDATDNSRASVVFPAPPLPLKITNVFMLGNVYS